MLIPFSAIAVVAFSFLLPASISGEQTSPKATIDRANSKREVIPAWRPEARAIYDIARMPARGLAAKSNAWVLASVQPDFYGQDVQDAASRLTEDGHIMPPNPALTKHDRASVIVFTGRMQVLAELGKPPRAVTAFIDIVRVTESGNETGPPHAEGLYDVFRPPGGIVVCKENDTYPGRSRYYPALLIPAEWERFVVPAVDFWHARPRILDQNRLDVEGTVKGLRPLIDHENPFVACIAFRNLVREDLLETADAVGFAMKADKLRQGVFALALLRNGQEALSAKPPAWDFDDRPPRLEERTKLLAKAVASATDFSRVRGIALAAVVRYHVAPRNDPYWHEGVDLVDELFRKAAASPNLLVEDQGLVAELRRWRPDVKK